MLFAGGINMRKFLTCISVFLVCLPGIFAQEQIPEYHFELEEAIITATARHGKKQHRAEMRNLLDSIYVRLMEVDAPKSGEKFSIVSDIGIVRDNATITRDRMSGTLFELPEGRKDGKDSIALEVASYFNYLDAGIKRGLENSGSELLNETMGEKNGRILDSTFVHKALWRTADARTVLENTYQDEKFWNSTLMEDGSLSVVFSRSRKILGIVSAIQKIVINVDRNNYAIKSAWSDILVRVKLPFGYKLSPDELDVLNLVNLTGEEMEKFKIKSAVIHVYGIEKRRESSGRMISAEKWMKNTVAIADRKDTKLDFENTCSMTIQQ